MPKTVLEIDVDDAKFKAFAESLDKVQKALAEANKKLGEMGSVGNAAAEKTNKSFQKTRRFLDDINKAGRESVEIFKRMASVAESIAKSFANAAFSLAKWLAFGAIGSGFGLGALASVAAGTRREALGLGVSTGALRAQRVNLGRYVDVDTALANISQTQFDPTKGLGYQTFGILNQSKKTPDAILAEVLLKGGEVFKRFAGNRTLLEASGALQFTDYESLRRLSAEKRTDIAASLARSRSDTPAYELNAKAYQEFTTNMERAATILESSLINALVKLTPALTRFATGITKILTTFIQSPLFADWIDKAQSAIERFAKYLLSPEFAKDTKSFIEMIHRLSEEMAGLVNDLIEARDAIEHPGKSISNWFKSTFTFKNPFDEIRRHNLEKEHGLPLGTLDAIMQAEGPPGVSPKGAMGPYGLMPYTAKIFDVKYPMDEKNASLGAAAYFQQLINRYNRDYAKAFAAYNFGPGNVDKDIRAHGEDWRKYLPKETQNYLASPGIKIIIDSAPGATVQASAAQLSGAR